MTYVEFFHRTSSRNVSACLTHIPDRVIFIGDKSKLMKKHIANYKRVFADRGYNIEFSFKTVSRSNLDNAVELLSEIVEAYDDCVFDITGGDEILTLALGIVCSKYVDKNIQIHKFNIMSSTVYDVDKDGTTIYRDTPVLSIDDNIRIYGGEVVYGSIDEDETYKWELTPDFIDAVNKIWGICKGNVRYWNMQISILEAIENVGSHSDDGLTTVASRTALDQYLMQHNAKYKIAKGIISSLLRYGFLTSFSDDETTVTVSYKDKQIKKCLTKAGQALEMKIYLTAKDILDEDGVPVYNDALNGVVIDWDGKVYDEDGVNDYDTENEVDVMLMHNIVPVFISCKNGVVTSEELYKLNTVAERFGGRYSKKVLVATSISDFGEQGKYLRQRAVDMNIKLIEKVQDLDDDALGKKLSNLWNG